MQKYLSAVLTVVVLAVFGWVWWAQYVEPKSKILEAATACLHEQGYVLDQSVGSKKAWKTCLVDAEGRYATRLVLALGY